MVAIGVLGGVSGSPIADAAHSEPVAIVLDPAGAIEVTVGDLQTLTATVTDIDGLPVEGVGVEFTTFGFDVLGNETTSAAGIAEISFTRLVPGEDIVRAEFELDSFPVSSDDLVITWVAAAPPPGPSGPVDIELDPAGAIEVVVGTLQTLTATVTDIDGLPVEGVGVEFTTFGFDVLGNETTSAAGIAEISFTRLVPGEDIVRAEFELDSFPVSSDDLIVTWVGDFDGDGLPDATDPEPFGQHADPTFSQVPNAPEGVCICTPPMMNNQGGELQMPGPQVQNWFVKDDGDGDVDVTLTLTVVNPLEAGFHTIKIFNSANVNVAEHLKLQYHSAINLPSTSTTSTTLSVSGAAGEVYRVELTVEGDPANNPVPGPFPGEETPGIEVVARHYDLKFAGAIEAGMGSPSLRQIEAAPATWFLNVDAGEAPQIRVASVGLTAGAGTATIELRDPSGALVDSASPTTGPFDELLTGASSTTAGQWSLTVSGLDHHYWVDKLSGGDRGIYATWLTFGFGAIAVDLGGFAGSVGLDIERLGPGATSTVFSGTFPSSLPLLAPGEYRVTVTPPPGFDVTPISQIVFVGCKATTQVQFQLDAIPVDPPPVLTINKEVVNNDGAIGTPSNFTMTLDGNPVPEGTQIVLSPGTYTVGETGPFGYEGTIGGDCATDGTITLVLGDDKSCTITNDDIAPTITLVKQVINNDGGTAGPDDFNLNVGGVGVSSGVAIQVTARAPIVINETVGTGYAFVSITGSSVWAHVSCPAVLGGTVTLHEGDEITCVIVNNDIAHPPSGADPRTIGYWKNHQEHIQDLIALNPIGPPASPLTVADIVDILHNANAKDARNALRAQRMATVLNLRNESDPGGIVATVIAARDFLIAHADDPVTRKHPDRDEALDMKDLLDAYNNSGE